MIALPPLARDLLDGVNFATVATVEPDGGPQASIVWVKRDGDHVLFSTIKGRRKYTNMLGDPRLSVVVVDAADFYRFVEIRGRAQITDDPERELIEELSRKYTGRPFPRYPGEQRVIVRVLPDRVVEYS